jgi:hypothetical protein
MRRTTCVGRRAVGLEAHEEGQLVAAGQPQRRPRGPGPRRSQPVRGDQHAPSRDKVGRCTCKLRCYGSGDSSLEHPRASAVQRAHEPCCPWGLGPRAVFNSSGKQQPPWPARAAWHHTSALPDTWRPCGATASIRGTCRGLVHLPGAPHLHVSPCNMDNCPALSGTSTKLPTQHGDGASSHGC